MSKEGRILVLPFDRRVVEDIIKKWREDNGKGKRNIR